MQPGGRFAAFGQTQPGLSPDSAFSELGPCLFVAIEPQARLRSEKQNHTLQLTALVHEAHLRLTRLQAIDWQSRSHFFAIAANTMRQTLVDHARASLAQKRGAGVRQRRKCSRKIQHRRNRS